MTPEQLAAALASASAEQKAAACAQLLPFVALCPTSTLQDAFLSRIAERLGVDIGALRADLAARLPKGDARCVERRPPRVYRGLSARLPRSDDAA